MTDRVPEILATVAAAWNRGDATAAAACFTEDALSLEPPDRQRHEGRAALHDFFREAVRVGPMSMTWHSLFGDDEGRAGGGEYTFAWNGMVFHGVAVVEIRDGLIHRWREYQKRSDLSWERFVEREPVTPSSRRAPSAAPSSGGGAS